MRHTFLEYLSDRVLVCDGGMGTQLYAKGVFLNRCFDELNLSQPEMVREIHQEYFWAGAEILESNTFGANAIKLEPHGLTERLVDINAAGVTLAREVAGEAAYVAGSVGPLGVRLAPDGKLSVDEAKGLFAAQIEALAGARADLLSLETFSSVNELQAALQAVREVCDLPVMAQVNFDHEGNCLDGTKAEDFALRAEQWGADIIGLNCGVGPQVMLETIERIAGSIEQKMVVQPNAGQPRRFEGRNLYLSSPEYLASYARRFINVGVHIVGGCCGTTPAHIRAIREVVRTIGSARKMP